MAAPRTSIGRPSHRRSMSGTSSSRFRLRAVRLGRAPTVRSYRVRPATKGSTSVLASPARTGSERSCDARTLSSALARGSAPAESSSSSCLRLHRVRIRAEGREGSRAGRGGVSNSGSGNGPSGMMVSFGRGSHHRALRAVRSLWVRVWISGPARTPPARLARASHAPPVALGGILTATSRTLRDRPSGRSIVATAPALAPISALPMGEAAEMASGVSV